MSDNQKRLILRKPSSDDDALTMDENKKMLYSDNMDNSTNPHVPENSSHNKSDDEFTVIHSNAISPPPERIGSSEHSEPIKIKKNKFNYQSRIKIIPNNRQGQLNTIFLSSIPGLMKIAEVVIAFISFILAICSDRRSTQSAWTEHITFESMLVVSCLIIGYVCFPHLTLNDEKTREGLIVVELLFYGIHTLFYFIAIWLMIHLSAAWTSEGRGAAIMSSVLCVALLILFAIETIKKWKAWKSENSSTIVREPITKEEQTDVNDQV
ncbi:Marvel domain-containing protein [Strongyloides ratti]|uniref:Marvel domain-containing protein n=1 Tax=Strongyloides ratti TaxID=34506 RepID=A0A090KUQ9_STRRB|nr:Marvel domain-containing protein [Strongyloides ratti]CEF61215.1 Marvel domain-containing protein [Strongyloides ratti]